MHLDLHTQEYIYILSDCRTVGLSDGVFDSLTLFDTVYGSNVSETVSDSCRTVSDCRTVGLSDAVGLSEICRKYVGKLCRTVGPGLSLSAEECFDYMGLE